ncbi:hypothetical protein D9619_007007 [Psilocybe cf. subviscida]|uniref:SET domain-containing protein n=1 Tax=Psilocybe cf. subviscida TaxID=2480587 RepID=A0A8H5EXB1_9AGAR|nr:hypothetical protein D9619_007007 [Psilocybe cf. subviscida]
MARRQLKFAKSQPTPNKKRRQTAQPFTSSWQFFAICVAIAASVLYLYTSKQPRRTKQSAAPPEYDFAATDSSIFTVVDIPGKGKGVVAVRDIKQGEVILRERPLFTVPRNINASPSTYIANQLNKLHDIARASFLNLSYVNFPAHLDPDSSPDEVALAIFQTNAVMAGEGIVGIFPRMARLNHGCSSAFNVVYNWRDEGAFLIVHALKDIAKGQELLTTYTDSKRPRHERRAYLKEQYGFTCTCSVCSLPDALSQASDARLSMISSLYNSFARWGKGDNDPEGIDGIRAVGYVREIWDIEDEEGYWSERGQLASDAAWVAAAHSDASATQAWARKAIEWYSYEIGADAPQVRALRKIAKNPEKHQAWETRAKLEVGGPR